MRENQVVVFLKKLDPKSWAGQLAETGLETHVDEDEPEDEEN